MRRALSAPFFSYLVIAVLIVGSTLPLSAHAVLMQSKPKANSTVTGSDVPIWLRFNVRVDGSRSRLHLIASDGSEIAVPTPKQTAPDILESHVSGLKPGSYRLQWQVLASDGHISRGEVQFTVN